MNRGFVHRHLEYKRFPTVLLSVVCFVFLYTDGVTASVLPSKEFSDDKRTFLLPVLPHTDYGLFHLLVAPVTGEEVNVTFYNAGTRTHEADVYVSLETNFSIPTDPKLDNFATLTEDLVTVTSVQSQIYIKFSDTEVFRVPPVTEFGRDYFFTGEGFGRSDRDLSFVFVFSLTDTETEVCAPRDSDVLDYNCPRSAAADDMDCVSRAVPANEGLLLNNRTWLAHGARLKGRSVFGVMAAGSSAPYADGLDTLAPSKQLSPLSWEILPPVSTWASQFVIIPPRVDNEFLLKAGGLGSSSVAIETKTSYSEHDMIACNTIVQNISSESYVGIRAAHKMPVYGSLCMGVLNETQNCIALNEAASKTTGADGSWFYVTEMAEAVCWYSPESNITLISRVHQNEYQSYSITKVMLRIFNGSVARFRHLPQGFYAVRVGREATRAGCFVLDRPDGTPVIFPVLDRPAAGTATSTTATDIVDDIILPMTFNETSYNLSKLNGTSKKNAPRKMPSSALTNDQGDTPPRSLNHHLDLNQTAEDLIMPGEVESVDNVRPNNTNSNTTTTDTELRLRSSEIITAIKHPREDTGKSSTIHTVEPTLEIGRLGETTLSTPTVDSSIHNITLSPSVPNTPTNKPTTLTPTSTSSELLDQAGIGQEAYRTVKSEDDLTKHQQEADIPTLKTANTSTEIFMHFNTTINEASNLTSVYPSSSTNHSAPVSAVDNVSTGRSHSSHVSSILQAVLNGSGKLVPRTVLPVVNSSSAETASHQPGYGHFPKVLEIDTFIDKLGRTIPKTSQSDSSIIIDSVNPKFNAGNPTYKVQYEDDDDYDDADDDGNLLAVIVSLSAAVLAVLAVISIFLLIEVFSTRRQIRNTRIRPFLT